MISASIMGSILGFAGSALAPIVGYFEKKQAAKHEIQKMEMSAKLAQAGFKQDQIMYNLTAKDDEHKRLLEHDIELSKGTGIVSALQRLVRPLITYAFFGLFTVVEISMLIHLLSSGIDLEAALQHVWDDETQAIFATVITFWFGTRVFEKKAPRVS